MRIGKKMAQSFIRMSVDEDLIKSIEELGIKINPVKKVKNDHEYLFLRAINLLNFYEGDMLHESPLTYNLVVNEIASFFKSNKEKYDNDVHERE